jgi:hypothetical protein
MAHSSPAEREARQRDFLASLLALADVLAEAVAQKDLPAALAVSEQRRWLVAGAAAYVPPGTPWAPGLVSLAADVHTRTREVQHHLDLLIAEQTAAHGVPHTR